MLWTDIVNSFEDFWSHKPYYLHVRNDSRTLSNFKKLLSEAGGSVSADLKIDMSEVDRKIDVSRNNKETLRRIAVAFYKYLENKRYSIDTNLGQIRYYDYPFERQLEIAKYLHTPHRLEEIKKQFSIDERTVRSDIAALRDGIEVLGTHIQIEEETKGRKKYYKSSLNPVFLPLNLTQVYALTVYMPRISAESGSTNSDLLNEIASNIKAQLSDHAYERLFPNEGRSSEHSVSYVNDESLAMSKKGILMYLMKTGEKCSFYYADKKYRGSVAYCDDKYKIRLENGNVMEINPEEVDFIIDELEYR